MVLKSVVRVIASKHPDIDKLIAGIDNKKMQTLTVKLNSKLLERKYPSLLV